MGADAAGRLRPVLDRLIAEAVSWSVDYDRHPEVSREAVAALTWAFDHSHF